MNLTDFFAVIGIFALILIAAFSALWKEIRGIRLRLHNLEGFHNVAYEVLQKYKLMRREDRDPILDELVAKHGRPES